MLRTTTETGDIGLFSIRPVRSISTLNIPGPPTPSRHGQTKSASTPRLTAPLRARTPLSNIVPTRPSTSDSFDTHSSLRDDRRCLPSYRDTASEIISMYASDSQRSTHSPFSPNYHDDQRSFSMTSCSSRALPNKSSTGTMQSQASGPALQRPRSPFPYPTRLKRPGVRPSSPAVTESGAVDYSRMVEIDRVSQVCYLPCLLSSRLLTSPAHHTWLV